MLIAIAGSQGSGKSTVLKELEKRGYNVIQRKTSRSILAEWNVTLEQVYRDPELCRDFHDLVGGRKVADEMSGTGKTHELWFTERTFADVFTYALITLGPYRDESKWLDEFYNKCKEFNAIYSCVFYITGGHFQIENDGVRNTNAHFSKMVDLVMFDTTKQMVSPDSLYQVGVADLTQRVELILGITNIKLSQQAQ